MYTREEDCWLLLLSTAAILLASRARKQNLPPCPLVTHCTYGCQNSHIRHLTNSTFQLFNSYKRGSVFRVLTGSITPFHLCLHSSLKETPFTLKKKFHCVTGGQDSISRNSLFETFLMMCRSTSDLSLLVSMQFFPNYRITLTAHITHKRDTQGKLSESVMSGSPSRVRLG